MSDNSLSYSFGRLIIRHPFWVLLISVSLVFVLSAGMKNITLKNDYRVNFSQDNPQLLAFEAIQATFNKSDNVLFIVEPNGGTVFNRKVLAAIHRLTEAAWQISYSSRVDSITNFQHTHADNEDLIVVDLVKEPLELTDSDLAKIKHVALNEPLLVDRLVSKTGHVSGVNVTLQLPEKNPAEPTEVAEQARRIKADIESQYPGITIHLTGLTMMNNAFNESAMSDNVTLVPLMYGILLLILYFSLRSFTAVLLVVCVLVFSVASALGGFAWLGGFLTPSTTVTPVIISTIVVSDSVHLLSTMLHNLRSGSDKVGAIQESIRINFQPIVLTSATTLVGFLTMNFSDVPPFRDLGNIVAIGVIVALVLTLSFLPACLTLLPIKTKLKQFNEDAFVVGLAKFVIRRNKSLLLINALIIMLLSGFALRNELNDEFVKYFDKTIEFRQATDFLNDNMGGIYTIELAIRTGREGGVNEPVFLQKIERLVNWLDEQPEVIHVNSIVPVIKRLNKNMHDDRGDEYRLPEKRELVAQYLLMYEMSLPYGLDLNDQISIDKSDIRVVVTLQSLSSNQMLDVERRIDDWLHRYMPEHGSQAASTGLMFAHIGKRNIISMIGGSILALLLISFLLIGAFRSVRLGLISLIPNLAPGLVAFGIWYFIDGRVGLGLSVVTSLTLGIVVDDTIHFISKYQRARKEKGLTSSEAVHYAFSTVGEAIWKTSVVLVSGFTVLSFSHFTVNSDLGMMAAMTIMIALIMDLLFLPPLLMALDRK